MLLSLKHQLIRDKGFDLFVPIFIRASLKMTAIDIPCIPTDTAVKMENEYKLRALITSRLHDPINVLNNFILWDTRIIR